MIKLPRSDYNKLWNKYLSLIERHDSPFNNTLLDGSTDNSLKHLEEAEIIEKMAYELLIITILEEELGLSKQNENDIMIEINPCIPV